MRGVAIGVQGVGLCTAAALNWLRPVREPADERCMLMKTYAFHHFNLRSPSFVQTHDLLGAAKNVLEAGFELTSSAREEMLLERHDTPHQLLQQR